MQEYGFEVRLADVHRGDAGGLIGGCLEQPWQHLVAVRHQQAELLTLPV